MAVAHMCDRRIVFERRETRLRNLFRDIEIVRENAVARKKEQRMGHGLCQY